VTENEQEREWGSEGEETCGKRPARESEEERAKGNEPEQEVSSKQK